MSMRSERDDLIKKGILLPDSSLSPVSSAPSDIGDSAQASDNGACPLRNMTHVDIEPSIPDIL
jgi:hypothetical protein